jgi:hypothetical protein
MPAWTTNAGWQVETFSIAEQIADILSDSANTLFIAGNDDLDISAYLYLLNSTLVKAVLTTITPVRKMEIGFLQRFPIPWVPKTDDYLVDRGSKAIKEAGRWLTVLETSQYFVRPGNETDSSLPSSGDAEVYALFDVPESDVDFLVRQSQIFIRATNEVTGISNEVDADTQSQENMELDDNDEEDSSDDAKLILRNGPQCWSVGIAFGRPSRRSPPARSCSLC